MPSGANDESIWQCALFFQDRIVNSAALRLFLGDLGLGLFLAGLLDLGLGVALFLGLSRSGVALGLGGPGSPYTQFFK